MFTRVLESLPHGPPFRFVDEVLELEPGVRALGLWRVHGEQDFFRGHFPGHPIVPGVLIAEALAQLSGVVAFSKNARHAGRPARLAQVNVKFLAGITPPADVWLESMLVREMSNLCLFNVTATVSGEAVASGSLVLSSVTADLEQGHSA